MTYIRLAEVEIDIKNVVAKHDLSYLLNVNIAVVYNPDSRSRAVARIWGLGKIFQEVYGPRPAYVVELRHFAKLSCEARVKTLAHELAHAPSTGSGALRSHNSYFWRDYRTSVFLNDFPSLRKRI